MCAGSFAVVIVLANNRSKRIVGEGTKNVCKDWDANDEESRWTKVNVIGSVGKQRWLWFVDSWRCSAVQCKWRTQVVERSCFLEQVDGVGRKAIGNTKAGIVRCPVGGSWCSVKESMLVSVTNGDRSVSKSWRFDFVVVRECIQPVKGKWRIEWKKEKIVIEVKDAPFIIVSWHRESTSDGDVICCIDNLQRTWLLSRAEPLYINNYKGAAVPYMQLPYGCFARVARNVFYQWAEIARFVV